MINVLHTTFDRTFDRNIRWRTRQNIPSNVRWNNRRNVRQNIRSNPSIVDAEDPSRTPSRQPCAHQPGPDRPLRGMEELGSDAGDQHDEDGQPEPLRLGHNYICITI